MHKNFIIHPLVEKQLGCFHFLPLMIRVEIGMAEQVFL